MAIATYSPSGRFHPSVFAIVPGLGLAAGVVGGWLYQFLIDLLPFIILGACFTLFFGFGLGLLVGLGLKWGKCRNLTLAIALGACVGVTGLGFSYFWAYQSVKSDVMADPELAQNIGGFSFGDYLEARVEYGWTVTSKRGTGRGTSWSGGMVYVIWLIEALIVVGVASVAPLIAARRPFCEGCDCWATSNDLGEVHGIDVPRIKAAAAGGDWGGIAIPATDHNSPVRAGYTLYSCPDDGEPLHVSVELRWEEASGKKSETKKEEIIEYGVITPELLGAIQQSIASPPQAAPPQRPRPPARPGTAAPRPNAGPRPQARPGAPARPPQRRPRPPQG
jgi:hypothetical protein